MPDVLNVQDTTWCGQQASEIFYKPAFRAGGITDQFFLIVPNIKSRRQMVLDEQLQYIVQISDACARTPNGEVINLSEKFLEVCPLKINLDQCAKNLEEKFTEEWLRTGNSLFDITGTAVEDYIIRKVTEALALDLWRIIWFGDTASDDERYNVCDGFWTRIFASVGEYDTDIKRVTVAEGALGECAALDYLRQVYEGASDLLNEVPENQKYFMLTRSMYDNYRTCLEERCCGDRGTILLEDGRTQFFFRGIPVYLAPGWDRYIRNDLNNEFPHRIVYATYQSLAVGSDELSDTTTVEVLYNPYEKNNQIDAEFKLGTQIPYNELVAVAY